MLRLLLSRPLSEPEIAAGTTPEEQAAAAAFAPRRRAEWLSWRALVRREAGRSTKIGYDEAGAPVLEGVPLHLSVSHCEGTIAVALSEAPCAVDVETLDRNFGRVAPRYMTSGERALWEDARWPAVVWCAKEAMYKYAGRRKPDLLRDLRIEAVDPRSGTLGGRICGGELLPLRFLLFADRVAVWLA